MLVIGKGLRLSNKNIIRLKNSKEKREKEKNRGRRSKFVVVFKAENIPVRFSIQGYLKMVGK